MTVPLREGVDYYLDNGLMVLTEAYLRNRGYCCDNRCRHCPYEQPRPNPAEQAPEADSTAPDQ